MFIGLVVNRVKCQSEKDKRTPSHKKKRKHFYYNILLDMCVGYAYTAVFLYITHKYCNINLFVYNLNYYLNNKKKKKRKITKVCYVCI